MAARRLGDGDVDLPAHQADRRLVARGELADDLQPHGIRERLEDGEHVDGRQVGGLCVVALGGRGIICLTLVELICTMPIEH